ncbi:MAG: EamA family transporter [Caldilineaceae bacterium]|nr:EamA family transporter [Caldilineaceae bacterium]
MKPADLAPASARNGTWFVLMAAVCWGTTGTAQAFAPEGATPLAVGAVRLAVGGMALLLWALLRRSFHSGRPWPLGATLSAAVCMAAYQLCFFAAVDRTGVAAGTVVAIGSAPVLAGLLSWLVNGDTPGWPWAAATLLATLGCALLGLSGGSVTIDPIGILLAIGAGASYAIYVLASKGLVAAQRPEAAMGVVFALGALLLTPLFFWQDFGWLAEARGLAVALHLGLITTALAYALFAEGLTITPVATAVTLTLGEPLTATLLGVLVLRESLNGMALVGMALLLAGLLILAMSARRSVQRIPVAEKAAL